MKPALPSRLLDIAPLSCMSDSELGEFLTLAGAHSPSAFLIRRDVSVRHACDLQNLLLSRLHAVLSLMMESDPDPTIANGIDTALAISEQAMGMHSLVFKALLEEGRPA